MNEVSYDLALRYKRRSPPVARGYWEQTVTIYPGGVGEVTVTPDYPSPHTPVWTKRFVVPPAHIEWLRAITSEHRIFDRAWSAGSPRVGGGSESLTVQLGGRRVDIPPNVDEEDEAAAAAMRSAVQQLVPPSVREMLDAKRQSYRRPESGGEEPDDRSRPRRAWDFRFVGALIRGVVRTVVRVVAGGTRS